MTTISPARLAPLTGVVAALLIVGSFAAAETVGDVPAEVTQTLAVLGALFLAPFAVGVLVALLVSTVAILRHGALPRWLGYVTILIAVVFVMPAGFGAATAIAAWILASAVLVFIVSVVVFLRETRTERASSRGRASTQNVGPLESHRTTGVTVCQMLER